MKTISGTAYMSEEELSEDRRQDLHDCMNVAAALHEEIRADPFVSRRDQPPIERCIFMALAALDILHGIGRTDAVARRSGLAVHGLLGDELARLVIGDPKAPALPKKINMHATVSLGEIRLDPSLGQTRRWWNHLPDFAAFLMRPSDVHTLDLGNGLVASTTTVCQWSEADDRHYRVAYFKLPRPVDLATRNWRSAPDALPELRASLVAGAIARLRQKGLVPRPNSGTGESPRRKAEPAVETIIKPGSTTRAKRRRNGREARRSLDA